MQAQRSYSPWDHLLWYNKSMRHTARGIIIRNKKILLVTAHEADFYWTPGGGIKPGETIVEALSREIKEELGASVTKCKSYYSYEYRDQKVDNFIVEITEHIAIGKEITNYVWYDSTLTATKTSDGFRDMLRSRLISDGLIT